MKIFFSVRSAFVGEPDLLSVKIGTAQKKSALRAHQLAVIFLQKSGASWTVQHGLLIGRLLCFACGNSVTQFAGIPLFHDCSKTT
jgi:hypothetical protein